MADEPTHAPAETDAGPDALTLRALVEALLFVSDGPVTSGALSRALDVTPRRIELTLRRPREHAPSSTACSCSAARRALS